MWQGKGEEHFLPDPWYDGLEGESYDGFEGGPRTSERRRSMIVEPTRAKWTIFFVIAGRNRRATRKDELRVKERGGRVRRGWKEVQEQSFLGGIDLPYSTKGS